MAASQVIDTTILPKSNEEQLRHEVAAATLLLNHSDILTLQRHLGASFSSRGVGDEDAKEDAKEYLNKCETKYY